MYFLPSFVPPFFPSGGPIGFNHPSPLLRFSLTRTLQGVSRWDWPQVPQRVSVTESDPPTGTPHCLSVPAHKALQRLWREPWTAAVALGPKK